MGAQAPEEKPQAAQDGDEEAAPAAALQQETHLLHRLPRRPFLRQDIFQAEDRAQAFEQGAAIARTIERRRQGRRACGRARTKGRTNAASVPEAEAKEAAAEASDEGLSQARQAR